MKRILAAILCGLMIVSTMIIPAAAENVLLIAPAPAGRDVTDHETCAVALKQLGLFMGISDTEFDLERAPTRIEALVMLIRVLGKEEEALNGTWEHPFNDVPLWDGDKANKYVGYAYENKLTNGMDEGAGIFGSETAANAQMYLTFVLRALGYTDKDGADFTYADPFTLANEVGILADAIDVNNFWRADVAAVSYLALDANMKEAEETLADKLIEAEVFTVEEFCEAMGRELPPAPTTIKNADMTMEGTAKFDKKSGVVTLGGGSANKAILSGDFQASNFAMSATFMIPEDSDSFSFVMGKNSGSWGYWAELTVEKGKSYLKIDKDDYFDNPPTSTALKFDLVPGKEYTLKLTFSTLAFTTSQKEMKVEVFGADNEYYTATGTANAYGAPYYYSNAETCIVSDFDLSIQHYFDVENAKVAIFGHSFVEADTMASFGRSNGFAYMMEKELTKKYGDGTVLNFGLGGDGVNGMYNKIVNSERFIKNCDYVFLCIGGNDSGMGAASFIAKLKASIAKLKEINSDVIPVLFTVSHANKDEVLPSNFADINKWIKEESGCVYVDMYALFGNDDGTAKKDLFLDHIHPTVAGHKLIYDEIVKVCPELFK